MHMGGEYLTHGDRKRLQILKFIEEFMVARRYPPTVREICDGVDLSSTASVTSHLRVLESKGLVTMREGEPRTVVPSAIRVIVESKETNKNTLDNSVE